MLRRCVCPRYVERVSEVLRQKLKQADILVLKRATLAEKRQEALEEQATLEPRIDLLAQRTHQLHKLVLSICLSLVCLCLVDYNDDGQVWDSPDLWLVLCFTDWSGHFKTLQQPACQPNGSQCVADVVHPDLYHRRSALEKINVWFDVKVCCYEYFFHYLL